MAYISGTNLNDTLTGTSGNDTLDAFDGNDILSGGDGNDILKGGSGADAMTGGSGNDTYYVDNTGDSVTEGANGGTDKVISTITYDLALNSNVENLTLSGLADINGTGNELNNVLVGNSGINTLSGLDGNDNLDGGAGDDILSGGDGNDILKGGSGADAMTGGSGNDTYYVDDGGDAVTELSGEGTDIVMSTITYALGANVENLTLSGSAGINGTGNELDNILIGNTGARAFCDHIEAYPAWRM